MKNVIGFNRLHKQGYIAPFIKVEEYSTDEPLLIVSAGDKNIGYGGVDTQGALDPSSRKAKWDDWDDDDDEY